jgi:hypothetical protein
VLYQLSYVGDFAVNRSTPPGPLVESLYFSLEPQKGKTAKNTTLVSHFQSLQNEEAF